MGQDGGQGREKNNLIIFLMKVDPHSGMLKFLFRKILLKYILLKIDTCHGVSTDNAGSEGITHFLNLWI